MQPFPGPRSVILLDNCPTHKSVALREVVEAAGTYMLKILTYHDLMKRKGCQLLFLPPYSPDFSLIEESFSCVKAYLRRNFRRFQDCEFPEQELVDACFTVVNAEKARGWFKDCGYL